MPIVLRHLPILDHHQTVVFPGQELAIKPNQLVVWVSLSRSEDEPGKQPFPALIDTGFGYTFAMHANQLLDWAHLAPNYEVRSIRFNGIAYS